MNRFLANLASLSFFLLFASTYAQTDSSFFIRIKPLSDHVYVTTGSGFFTNQVIIISDKGLILIDTGISPDYARELRRIVKKELQRDDFIYVINTHSHWDHVQGNQVFTEAVIIGHEKCAARMKKLNQHNQELVRPQILREGSGVVDPNLPPPPPSPRFLSESDPDFVLTPPNLTFTDRLTLSVGNFTLILMAYGDAHTDNDIIVYIPEEGILAVGDLFFKNSLPKFGNQDNQDYSRWLQTLNWVLKAEHEIRFIVPGHDDFMERKDLELNRDYIDTLWSSIKKLVSNGLLLDKIQRDLSLEKTFPNLTHWNVTDHNGRNIHQNNIEFVYNYITNSNENRF